MKQLLKQEGVLLKKIIGSLIFCLIVIILVALNFTGTYSLDGMAEETSVIEIILKQLYLYDDTITYQSVALLPMNSFILMFLPIIITFPFLNLLHMFNRNKMNHLILLAIGKWRYLFMNIVNIIISSMLVIKLSTVIYRVLLYLLLPHQQGVLAESGITWGNLGGLLTSDFLYCLLVASIILITSSFTQDIYLCLCVPFILIYGFDLIMQYFSLYQYTSAALLLNYAEDSLWFKLFVALFSVVLIILYLIKNLRRRSFGE